MPERGQREQRRSATEVGWGRRYLVEFFVGMTAAVVLILIPADAVVPAGAEGWRLAWALAPLVPLLWVCAAVARHVMRVDELQRRMILGAMGWGFGVAMMTAIATALVRSAGVAVEGAEWVTFAAGMAAFALAVVAASLRASR